MLKKKAGHLIDCRLRKRRELKAAKKFFETALELSGKAPEKITNDKHQSYPRSIKEVLGKDIKHRINKYLNTMIEQHHREIKQRYETMRYFRNFRSAQLFCKVFDKLKNFYKIIGDRNTKRTLATRFMIILYGHIKH
jgi:putative transposase